MMPRLGRRQVLHRGALTVAGIAGASALEALLSPSALAASDAAGSSPVSNFQLLSAGSTPTPGSAALQVSRHAYRFDYQPGQTFPMNSLPPVPADLIATYRLNAGPAYASAVVGGPAAERLTATVQSASFKSPADAPAEFPPAPGTTAPTAVPLPPEQLLPVSCYRLVQPLDSQTLRVFDWCSLYGFEGNFVVITAGSQLIGYRVNAGAPPASSPTPGSTPMVVNAINPNPVVSGFDVHPSATPDAAISPVYYSALNDLSGASVTWTASFVVSEGQALTVEAYIPGSDHPEMRTAHARYEISNANGVAVVVASQQAPASRWISLGIFPFNPGTWYVDLSGKTGEPAGTREVVASAVRWRA